MPNVVSRFVGIPTGLAALAAALVLLAFIVRSLAEARSLRVLADDLVRPDFPAALDGLRVVFIADVHAGPLFGVRRMHSLVARVNALAPDVLLLGGDYVGGQLGGADIFYAAAPMFGGRYAKVAVLGNHDVREGADRARQGLRGAGFVVLENANVAVSVPGRVSAADVRGDGAPAGSARLWIAGVEDLYTGRPDVAKAAEGIAAEDVAILVSHNPDVFATQLADSAAVWDLALAGHTHAGQVTLFGHIAPYLPSRYGQRYRSGWLEESGVPVLVSGGVGTVTVPLRFFAPPEIHLITLHGSAS